VDDQVGSADASGMRVLIVGASSGIGREVAIRLSGLGARVVGCARRVSQMADLRGVVSLECDVTIPAHCRQVVASASTELGGLDALVYAAGLTRITPLDRTDPEEWHDIFAVNVVGAALVTAAALAHLTAAGSQGRALFLSSDSAELAYPGLVAYSASKAALAHFCRGLHAEYPSLHVSEVFVGPTSGTDAANNFDPTEFGLWASRWFDQGMIRFGLLEPSDVATIIIAAMLSEAPPARVQATGPSIDAPGG